MSHDAIRQTNSPTPCPVAVREEGANVQSLFGGTVGHQFSDGDFVHVLEQLELMPYSELTVAEKQILELFPLLGLDAQERIMSRSNLLDDNETWLQNLWK